MYVIAGLGNPEKKYNFTRHNIGFLIIDQLLQKLDIKNSEYQKKFHSHSFFTTYNDKKLLILKPQTYMNNSGKAILSAKTFYKIDNNKIIIAVDDIDINFGQLKVKPKGSAGGHNGLKSISEMIGKDFCRVRAGIGNNSTIPLTNFVLSKFSKEEMSQLDDYTKITAESILHYLDNNADQTMNIYNKNHL